MPLVDPPHPGKQLREDVLPTLGMTITALAQHLGYSRVHLSTVLNCRASMTADLAWRLELAGLGDAKDLLSMQANYDLREIQKQMHAAPPCGLLRKVHRSNSLGWPNGAN